MTSRTLLLLSPYQVPARNSLLLAQDDVASFLNGYALLWHPAALWGSAGPPVAVSPYDHELPQPDHLYALPENPPIVLPDDWEQRVREAGSASFRCPSDRSTGASNLRDALSQWERAGDETRRLVDLPWDRVAAFLGIGFGFQMIEALFEAMEHEKVLSVHEFWAEVKQSMSCLDDPDPEAYQAPLRLAAQRLLEAREVVYPVALHLVDLFLLEDRDLQSEWPCSISQGNPVNVIASARTLLALRDKNPERFALLRERVEQDSVEICGGCYVEREDALLPFESQVWNLRRGLSACRELLGKDVQVFARKRTFAHPQLPQLLHSVGLRRTIFLSLDAGVLPTYHATVISLPGSDGKQLDAFARTPFPAENPQTYFHWAHYLHKTIAQDHTATLAIIHQEGVTCPSYGDLLELSRLAPVLGQWTTLSAYFNEALAGEYASTPSADDFHLDYLSERTDSHAAHPVSWFAMHARLRRRLDTLQTLAAMQRGLRGKQDPLDLLAELAAFEECTETGTVEEPRLQEIEQTLLQHLSERLLSRAGADTPGLLFFNACSFARRIGVEVEGVETPLRADGPLKGCQLESGKARLVVEVPALGFAWVPRRDASPPPSASSRMRMADERSVRNEFLEAQIDPVTGGLKAIRDPRTRVNRVGQQIVYNPGSVMRCQEVKVVSTGPVLGELLTTGVILDGAETILATYKQRLRVWMGRPVLELRIELHPQELPIGYPWHAYYAARFAWRDERASLLRGVNGASNLTTHTRPQSPDYLELRSGRLSTLIMPGGLPFHQRHGGRMLDVMLVPQGESATAFDLGLSLDREYPMQTALGMITPVPFIHTTKGPPHIGAAGWLFHLDSPNLCLLNMSPLSGQVDGVVAHLLECAGISGQAEWRCVRDPQVAAVQDARGEMQFQSQITGDAVQLDYSPGEFICLRTEFSS